MIDIGNEVESWEPMDVGFDSCPHCKTGRLRPNTVHLSGFSIGRILVDAECDECGLSIFMMYEPEAMMIDKKSPVDSDGE